MKTLIINGTIISDGIEQDADICFEDGLIKLIGELKGLDFGKDVEIIDAEGKYVLPGVIDPHINFGIKINGVESTDDFESGTRAAVAGGVTTVIDFVLPNPDLSLAESVKEKQEKVSGRSFVDFSFHIILGKWESSFAKEIPKIIRNEGIPTFKMFFAGSSDFPIVNEGDLLLAMRAIKDEGMVLLHPENQCLIDCLTKVLETNKQLSSKYFSQSRPVWVESEAIRRSAIIAAQTNSRLYFTQLTSAIAFETFRQAKEDTPNIFAQTSLPYLILSSEILEKEDGYLFIKTPPLRGKEDKWLLWNGIETGLINVVSSDHTSFLKTSKENGREDFRKSPDGLPGIEWLLPILYSEGVEKWKISLPTLVHCLCDDPAKLFGIYPQKGTLQIGSDADIVIFDLGKITTLSSEKQFTKCDFNPYEGMSVKGAVEMVFLRGKPVFKNGEVIGPLDGGKFLKRQILIK